MSVAVIHSHVISLQLYAVSTVLWRVYTFNNCEEAAKELQKVR